MASKAGKGKAVREFKSSGNKAMSTGAFAKAARQYTRALELDPGNAILYSNRSAAHFNLRQFAESLEDAESAILCDAQFWKAYKRKGLSLIHMQRYEEAIEALEQGLKIVKKNAEMEKNLEFARACQEQAQNLYILPEPHMMQRLESVPVFIVTDDVGQPFFITYEDGQQVCTFYFDKSDADSTLDWIKSENPDLGDTARVIHITLNQAFNLAQETQKQYYEETTRAAVEEDRRAAAEAKAQVGASGTSTDDLPIDVDGSDEDALVVAVSSEQEQQEKEDSEVAEAAASSSSNAPAKKPADIEVDAPNASSDDGNTDDESKKDENKDEDSDSLIDDNAPLSFQFRPELRQVQVAVELLNKNPNPPVRPILRDPPSVRKAKAEAAAAAAVSKADEDSQAEADGTEANDDNVISMVSGAADLKKGEPAQDEAPKTDKVSCGQDTKEDVKCCDKGCSARKKGGSAHDDSDDEELTVDNFNGIPIFQAKGLTLLQNNEQLIPLFFSKWDLEEAWKQLMQGNAPGVPAKCEIDVGTLEDVLRRMSESKTKEFESVFFVPSRESMKAINAKFPLDDLTAARPSARPTMRKAAFSKAKQVAARGGTKDEVRAAIREDLELAAERQRMAEIIAQIEQARRLSGANAAGLFPDGRKRSGRIDRTMRRNAQRMAQKQAARKSNRQTHRRPRHGQSHMGETSPMPRTPPSTATSATTTGIVTKTSDKTAEGEPSTKNNDAPKSSNVQVAVASPVAPQETAAES